MTVDPNGDIYFVDASKFRVIKINSDGRTLASWGGVGQGDGKFIEPKDVVLNNRGYLFVLDSSNSLVQKFETPIVMQIEESLAAEQFRKLQELSYAEAAAAAEAEAAAEVTAAAEAEAEAEAMAAAEAAAIPDTTKPIISPPADLVIEATGSLTFVELGLSLIHI